jgi:hypothetical protein
VEEAVPKAQAPLSPQPASITAEQPQADNKPPLADN